MFQENEKGNPYFEAMICNTIEVFKGIMDFGIELPCIEKSHCLLSCLF